MDINTLHYPAGDTDSNNARRGWYAGWDDTYAYASKDTVWWDETFYFDGVPAIWLHAEQDVCTEEQYPYLSPNPVYTVTYFQPDGTEWSTRAIAGHHDSEWAWFVKQADAVMEDDYHEMCSCDVHPSLSSSERNVGYPISGRGV